MIQVCDLSFANSSITDTLGNYSLVSSGTVTISGHTYPANTDPILYVTDSSYSCIEFGQTATYSNGAIIQAGIPDYGSENWAVEFRARVTSAMPEYGEWYVIFYGFRAPYDDKGTIRTGGYWSIAINNSLNALEFSYVDHYDSLTIKDNLDFTSWHLYKVTKTAEEILTLHIDGVLVATIDLEQQIGYKTRATLGSFALLGAVEEFPTASHRRTNQSVRLADVKVYADPMGHAEKAISLDNLSRVFRNYNTWLGAQLSGQIGDGTLTIQKNGTNVATFTANQSTAVTANITVPTKTSDLTNDSNFVESSDLATVATSGSYNDLSNKPTIPTVNNATLTIQRNGTTVDTFTANASVDKTININTADDTKIPLAGSNAISGDLIPATTDSVNLGGPSYQWNQAYIKSLTINGVVCGDILTHNASEFVPRSGGAVMTTNVLGRTVNDEFLMLRGGTAYNNGAQIVVFGKDNNSSPGCVVLRPTGGSDSTSKIMFLYPDGTWTWTGTAVQLVSDQRYKQQIAEIDDKLLDAWEDVDLVQFKYNDAVDQKKDKARLHTGYVVQQIDSACKSHNVDISAYGLYCHEEYPEETEEVEVERKDGTKTKETKVIREASEHYSLRYTEVYAVECMYLRRCIKQLTARIEQLEKGKEPEAGK